MMEKAKRPWYTPGIRARLMLAMAAIVTACLLAVLFIVSCLLQPAYDRHIRESLLHKAQILTQLIDGFDGEISNRDFFMLYVNEDFIAEVNEVIQDGRLDIGRECVEIFDSTLYAITYTENLYPCLVHGGGSGMGFHLQLDRDTNTALLLRKQLLEEGGLDTVLTGSDGGRQLVTGLTSADGRYGVLISRNLSQVDEAGSVLNELLPAAAVVLLGISLIFALVFSHWFTLPLRRLSGAARRMAAGDYSVRVESHSRDEVGTLTDDFNHMADEVRRSYQMQRELIANVSHDMRTPLTLIKGYAETIRDLTGDVPEKRDRQLSVIIEEADRLSALVSSVMDYSKVSSGAEKPAPARFDMAALCTEVAGHYTALCEQNGWTLDVSAGTPCEAEADRALMERVLHNLLANATHHLGEDGVFLLRCIPVEGGCRVEVEDHGSGISQEDLPHIFDRYYRSRNEAGRPGSGLGLAITKAILQEHGFHFGVNSTVGKGSVFWFDTIPNRPDIKAMYLNRQQSQQES